MKKTLIVFGALAAATAIQFASPAVSVPNSNVARRVTALESKVKTLRASVASVTADAFAAKNQLECMTATGVTRFGDPASQKGYVWIEGGSGYYTTALDLTPSGQPPTLYVAAVANDCVTSASPMFSKSSSQPSRAMNGLRK